MTRDGARNTMVVVVVVVSEITVAEITVAVERKTTTKSHSNYPALQTTPRKQMNEKTEQLVRELAEKFGTTADHLWGVLVKQAFVYASTETIFLVVSGAILGVAFMSIAKKMKQEPGLDDDHLLFASFTFGVLLVVLLLGAMFSLPGIVSGFVNPEYWALKQLLP